MNLKKISFLLPLLSVSKLVGATEENEDQVAQINIQNYLMVRGESLPVEHFEDATDPYLEGYIQGLVDIHYNEFGVLVSVRDHKVYLSKLPKNKLLANSIIAFVSDIPGVQSVEVEEQFSQEELETREIYTERPQIKGIWFPQSTVLFPPLTANPRELTYSAAYRGGDKVIGKNVAAVSLGDDFPIFRWRDVFAWHGDLQIGIGGGIWAVFNYTDLPDKGTGEKSELVNTDYMLSIPLTYAFDQWAFRFRLYHISSHLGDEYLVNNPERLLERKNPSFEAIDLFGSYQFNSSIRGYLGLGVIFHSDRSFKMKPLYIQWGAEARVFGSKFHSHSLYGTPFLAIDIENWQQRGWDFDATIKGGYEWSKLQGIGRKMRAFVSYHAGFSYEGQFFNERTNYWEIGFSWGF